MPLPDPSRTIIRKIEIQQIALQQLEEEIYQTISHIIEGVFSNSSAETLLWDMENAQKTINEAIAAWGEGYRAERNELNRLQAIQAAMESPELRKISDSLPAQIENQINYQKNKN